MRFVTEKLTNQNDMEGRSEEQKTTRRPNPQDCHLYKSVLKFFQTLEESVAVEPLGTVPSHGPMEPTSNNPSVRSIGGKTSRRKLKF